MAWMWGVHGQWGGKFSRRRRPPWVRVAGVWNMVYCRVAGSARARLGSAPSRRSQAMRSQAMAWVRCQAALAGKCWEGSRSAPVSLPTRKWSSTRAWARWRPSRQAATSCGCSPGCAGALLVAKAS